MNSWPALLAACALLASPQPAMAQGAPAAPPTEDNQDILVTARLSGAPIWEVRRGESVVLLVGEIQNVPKATPWRPQSLERATRRASSVIIETKMAFSIGDIFRLVFKLNKLTKLPKGKTSADYLSPAMEQRLEALGKAHGTDYRERNFLASGFGMMMGRLKINRDTTDDASDVVRKAAGRENIKVRPVGEMKGKVLLDNLLQAPPETGIGCLNGAMTAVEAGPQIIEERGLAWTRHEIPTVMASPLEKALGSCWPWSEGAFGPAIRAQWITEIGTSLARKGTTLAVAPLRILAEEGGVLDRLRAQGLEIKGPMWRADMVVPAAAAP